MTNQRPQPGRGKRPIPKTVFTAEYKLIVEKLVAARKAAGLSQEQAAERIGVTQTILSRSEVGRRRLDIVELRRFLKVYKVNETDFIVALYKESDALEEARKKGESSSPLAGEG